MPKKQRRKQSSETSENFQSTIEIDSVESDNEVIDGKRYGRRQIQSNWDRYRPESPKLLEEEEKEERIKSDDFAALLNAPADCNYFRFKSEKNWESEAVKSSFSGLKMFNLDLELLSNALSCIPFYERVDLDESILSESDIENCNRKAEESQIRYKPMLDKFLKKLEIENEMPCSDKKELQVNVNVAKMEKQTPLQEMAVNLSPKVEDKSQFLTKKDVTEKQTEKVVKHATPGEEDLEDWLDSVLDD